MRLAVLLSVAMLDARLPAWGGGGARIEVAQTPAGQHCQEGCAWNHDACMGSVAHRRCNDELSECLMRCPGAHEVKPGPLPCCKAIGASCGDSRCTCDPEKCGT